MDSNLPRTWEECSIHDLIGCDGIFADGDWVESKDQSPDGSVRLIQLADIGVGEFKDKSSRYLTREKSEELGCTYLQKNDVLISRLPDPLGKCCLFPLEEKSKYVTAVDVSIVRLHKEIDARWFVYFFNSLPIRNQVYQHQTGSTRKRISRKNIGRIHLFVPPKNEQRRIVAKIEELFSELDKGVESLKTARAQLKTYRQSLLKAAFEGRLTPDCNAEEWERYTLGELLDFVTSGSRGWAKYYAEEGALFVRAQNLKNDFLDLEEKACVQLPERTEGKRTQVKKGDLLITITGANVTKAALVKYDLGKAYVSQHVALCRLSETVTPEFAYWYIVSDSDGRTQLNKMAYGAGKPGLNLTNIREIFIVLPPVGVQNEIVRIIQSRIDRIDILSEVIEGNFRRIEILRQSILKRAFESKLVPQDPDDEPASALLERIRQEQADAPKAKRRNRETESPA